ncbi:uncharacterized protein LOC134184278 [Corticium candelabrum]|uniref:uncharacterized protein LOC134184278 n=1 Tax=Corticium candelabrum TaxID=121492 RepID=UPI002E31B0AF|nr:uncharacterized protein LOC134184278 [Corticium candelabrum]
MQRVRQMLDEITSSSSSSSDSEGDSNSQPFHAPPGYQLNVISDSEVSETGVSAALRDDSRLTIVVAQLREIIGGDAAQEQLEEVAIAADYDVNRAVNYFFSL